MSWLFSRALVEAYSEATCSDGARSALLSGSPTPQAYLSPDRMTTFSRLSPSWITFRPFTADLWQAVLTWCQEVSRARTSALQEKAQESTEPDQACGPTWRGSLARFDPATSSWRTAQPSLLEDLGESSVIWPRSGMTADGQCWELPMSGRRISGTGSGLWRTPTVGMLNADRAKDPEYTARKEAKGQTITLADQVKNQRMWPTPTCPNGGRSVAHVTDWRSERTAYTDKGKKVQIDLAQAVKLWPTPTVCGNYNRKGASASSGDGLATAVLKCATPTARDWKSGKASQATHDRNSRPLSEQIGGSLNPTWVEWLMGWPLGWTDLKPLATDRCPSAPQQLGGC